MGIDPSYSVFDKSGKPAVLESGRYYCLNCHRERKFIPFPFSGTIDGRCPKCGSSMVYKPD